LNLMLYNKWKRGFSISAFTCCIRSVRLTKSISNYVLNVT
jgi:hypothetical protein